MSRGLRIEVEQLPHACEHRHEHREQARSDVDDDLMSRGAARACARRRVARHDGADVAVHTHHTHVAVAVDRIDAAYGVPLQHLEHRRPVERRTVRERQTHEVAVAITAGARQRTSQFAGARAIPLAEGGVEPAQALESARVRDPRHGEPRVGEQAPSEQQAVGERELDRRHAHLALERAPKMPLAHAELPCELGDVPTIEGAGGDAGRRGASESRHRVAGRAARRQLGAAAQTGTIARPLGRRRGLEETTTVRIGDARRTDRSAIDPR